MAELSTSDACLSACVIEVAGSRVAGDADRGSRDAGDGAGGSATSGACSGAEAALGFRPAAGVASRFCQAAEAASKSVGDEAAASMTWTSASRATCNRDKGTATASAVLGSDSRTSTGERGSLLDGEVVAVTDPSAARRHSGCVRSDSESAGGVNLRTSEACLGAGDDDSGGPIDRSACEGNSESACGDSDLIGAGWVGNAGAPVTAGWAADSGARVSAGWAADAGGRVGAGWSGNALARVGAAWVCDSGTGFERRIEAAGADLSSTTLLDTKKRDLDVAVFRVTGGDIAELIGLDAAGLTGLAAAELTARDTIEFSCLDSANLAGLGAANVAGPGVGKAAGRGIGKPAGPGAPDLDATKAAP